MLRKIKLIISIPKIPINEYKNLLFFISLSISTYFAFSSASGSLSFESANKSLTEVIEETKFCKLSTSFKVYPVKTQLLRVNDTLLGNCKLIVFPFSKKGFSSGEYVSERISNRFLRENSKSLKISSLTVFILAFGWARTIDSRTPDIFTLFSAELQQKPGNFE